MNKNGRKTQWTSGKEHFWTHWTLKSKILLVVVIILAVLLALNIVPHEQVSTIGSELPTLIAGYHINLYDNGDGNPTIPGANMVTFPLSVLIHVNDTSLDAVFGALSDETNQHINLFHKNANGAWESWIDGEPWNPITEVEPYETYYVYVEKDCTLSLVFWD